MANKNLIAGAVVVTALWLASPFSHAEQLPLWELGMGVAAIRLPDYRGSEAEHAYVLPAPYFVYRGEFLKADRNGLRSTLLDSEKVDINLSLNATLPVNSGRNEARRGMADLKPSVEFGTTIGLNLWKSADDRLKLDFRAPLRASVTAESAPQHIGWLFSPNLNLDVKSPPGLPGWNLGLLAAALVHTRKNNAYFYSVAPADTTAARPAYAAPGGYAGSQFTMALSKRFPGYWAGGFLRYDTLAGAAFRDSPLVRQRSNLSAGVAVSWIFSESSIRVNVDE